MYGHAAALVDTRCSRDFQHGGGHRDSGSSARSIGNHCPHLPSHAPPPVIMAQAGGCLQNVGKPQRLALHCYCCPVTFPPIMYSAPRIGSVAGSGIHSAPHPVCIWRLGSVSTGALITTAAPQSPSTRTRGRVSGRILCYKKQFPIRWGRRTSILFLPPR